MYNLVNTCVELQRINVGEQAIQKIRPDPRLLVIVETTARQQILLCLVEELDYHDAFFRISAFAVSQSRNRALPAATRLRRASSTVLCHAGDTTDSGERDKSSQSASIAASFSRTVISFNGNVMAMRQTLSHFDLKCNLTPPVMGNNIVFPAE